MKVFITRKIPEIGIKSLQEKGYDVVVSSFDGVLPREELIQSVRGVDAILSLLTDKIDGEVMDAAGPQLKIVANYAVGFDNINLEDAKKRKIFATNTPDVLTDTVAEHTFALMISIAHRVVEGDKFMRAGRYKGWEPMLLLGTDMMKKTLGIIGLGRIGGRVAYIGARGFDMKVMYYDVKRNEEFEKQHNAVFASIDDILKQADFITLHVPLLPATKHLMNEEKFNLMKPTAYLVNTSRGPVIDENALVAALKEGKIKGAALDVFENEPETAPGLSELDNAVITPHIASGTKETRDDMAKTAVNNIIEALEGRTPPNNLIK